MDAVTPARKIDRLLFVYRANSGKLAAFVDSARKVLRLNGCTLCAITHGLAGEKSEWTECRAELGVPVDYLHLDELDKRLQAFLGENLPAVVAEVEGAYELLLGPEVLDRCRGSVTDFRARLRYHATLKSLALPI